ncbi:MAG: glycosyltransferase family 4 protein [Paludibacter sp.]
MKVAYLLGSLNRGGTETLLLDIFRNARKYDLDVVGIYRKTGILEQEFIQSGLQLIKIPFSKNIVSYLVRMRKILKKNKIEVVHAQQPIDAFFARLACAGTNIKIVLTLHGYDYHDTGIAKNILKYIIKRTHINIFVSTTQKEYYQLNYKLNPLKQQLVYNGISFDKLDISPIGSTTLSRATNKMTTNKTTTKDTTNNLREELQLPTDTLLMGTVGNFVFGRDQITLCRFLKRLKEENINFHFIFVGKRDDHNPDLFDDCVAFCEQNGLSGLVSFLCSRNDVPELLNQLDAFLYATDHDTFGIAVVEAMAVGVPVFVNDWGVMKEITDNGKQATLYKTKDESDLLQQFMLFLQDKETYKAKALVASRFVRDKFNIETHILNLKKVYNSLN